MSLLMSSIQSDNVEVGKKDTHSFPKGFHIFDLSQEDFFKELKKEITDLLPSERVYHFPKMTPGIDGFKTHINPEYLSDNVNFSTIYFLDNPIEQIPNLTKIIEYEEIYKNISSYYKNNFDSSFGVYHVSLYRNFKHDEQETGYLLWHSDNFPIYVKKILVYLTDILCEEDGPTQIKYDDGSIASIYGKAGTVIFFDMNFNHRGYQIQHSSQNKTRDMVYFSICPADFANNHSIQALGTDVIFPYDLNKCFTNLDVKRVLIPTKELYEETLFPCSLLQSEDLEWFKKSKELKNKNIYIWGIGKEAINIFDELVGIYNFKGYINWDIQESGKYQDNDLFTPNILKEDKNAYCIIALKRWRSIACYLENIDLKYKDDYIIKENNFKKDTQYPVIVGKRTYGEQHIINNQYFKLKNFQGIVIGAFCSIGPNSQVLGTHIYENRISTHPFVEFSEHGNYSNKNPWEYYQNTNGITRIGNDVWIGANVSIKPGIKIGNGVIIGAGSVVTKDIPSYAVVAGVPAKIMKYRYSEDKIDLLNQVQWWNWSDWKIKENIDLFLDEDKFFKYCKQELGAL